jgi:hypothetical protein
VIVLVVVLLVTNLVTLGVLAWFLLRPADHPAPSRTVAETIDAARPRYPEAGGTRRVITIEILNPIELAGSRSRIVGIAGSLAPGITRRIVYDQALKMVRRHLADEKVVADVRLHSVRIAAAPAAAPAGPAPSAGRTPAADREFPDFDPASPVELDEAAED